MSILDEYSEQVIGLVQTWGWTIVFLIVGWYFASPYIQTWQEKRILADARNPDRERILGADLKRARARQQLEFLKGQNRKSVSPSVDD